MKALLVALIASVALNVAIVTTFALRPSSAPPALRTWFQSKAEREAQVAAEAKQAERRRVEADKRSKAAQTRIWSEINSDDLKTLAARLRGAGFPPDIVREILSQTINARLKPRYDALNAASESKEYWKPRVYPWNDSKALAERAQLNRERTRLIKEALGDDPAGFEVENAWRKAQYGHLSSNKLELVQRVEQDYSEMLADIRAAMNGIVLPEDKAKLELLNGEKHADLAALLTPQELEEYEMRSSPVTSRLRSALGLMDATESEFRAIYALQKEYDLVINPGQGMNTVTYTPQVLAQREEAQAALQRKLSEALGEQRAAEFARASDYEFQNLARLAKARNLPVDSAVKAFDLRAEVGTKATQIVENAAMSAAEKRTALKELAQQTKTQLIGALGQEAGTAYANSAIWIQALERGTGVSFKGRSTSFRPVR